MGGPVRLVAAAVVLTGCFYAPPINQRPSVAIHELSDDPVHRSDTVMLEAIGSDADGQSITYAWHISACTVATDDNTDSDPPFRNDVNPTAEPIISFQVPAMRQDSVTPTKAVRVLLDAFDELGAEARPGQELILAVDDYAPVLAKQAMAAHHSVVDSHTQLYVVVSDQDDTPQNVALQWTVETPDPNAAYEITDLPMPTPTDSLHLTYGKSLLPHEAGTWTVKVVGTDPFGVSDEADFQIDVGDDLPPCITNPTPIASPTDALPLFESTLFQVPVVVDDLDVYPPQSGDPDLGVATFSWSIEAPGASAFAPLANTSNGVVLDPATYKPGDVVQLRVEVHDRVARDFSSCPADAPTCELDPTNEPGCLQRETWTVSIQ